MDGDDLASTVADVLDVDPEAFQTQVEEDAAVIERELAEGTFDNPQGSVGLEHEFYAVADDSPHRWTQPDAAVGSLARLPRRLLEYIGFEKELGLHNAELTTSPEPFNGYGLRAQEMEVCAHLESAQGPMGTEGLRLVSDGMWTIPPAGETARAYLTDSVEDRGIRIATNMSGSARYHAMANGDLRAGMQLDAPHVHLQADTVMPESLITSIQPHYQVPVARDLPDYFRYALRVAGPLLALAANSPFFPPDLYDADATPDDILADGHHEHRIGVFEHVLNVPDGPRKVCFPHDLDTTEEAIDRVVADPTIVPMPVTRGGRFDDEFAYFRRKHGTYWRWVRPVFDGATRSDANARIEFRPLPGQPTVRDAIAFQAVYAGALVGLYRNEHPVGLLPWKTAEENFYAAARDGIDADLTWVTAAGEETTEADALYDDLLAQARVGLESQRVPDEQVRDYVRPLRERVARRTTPATWKRNRVQDRLDAGETFDQAVYGVQRAYVARQKETLLSGTFADWLQ